jgi:hypothetical protein
VGNEAYPHRTTALNKRRSSPSFANEVARSKNPAPLLPAADADAPSLLIVEIASPKVVIAIVAAQITTETWRALVEGTKKRGEAGERKKEEYMMEAHVAISKITPFSLSPSLQCKNGFSCSWEKGSRRRTMESLPEVRLCDFIPF